MPNLNLIFKIKKEEGGGLLKGGGGDFCMFLNLKGDRTMKSVIITCAIVIIFITSINTQIAAQQDKVYERTGVYMTIQYSVIPELESIIKVVRPFYPREDSINRISGLVIAEATIVSGKVTELKLLRKSGNGFDKEVERTIKSWKYHANINTTMTVTVEFIAK